MFLEINISNLFMCRFFFPRELGNLFQVILEREEKEKANSMNKQTKRICKDCLLFFMLRRQIEMIS